MNSELLTDLQRLVLRHMPNYSALIINNADGCKISLFDTKTEKLYATYDYYYFCIEVLAKVILPNTENYIKEITQWFNLKETSKINIIDFLKSLEKPSEPVKVYS